MADYEILVRLSEVPDRRMRMSELADVDPLLAAAASPTRSTAWRRPASSSAQHCTDDRRGAFAVLTDHGWTTLVAAAPDHVESVRTHLVDQLTPEEFAALGAACRKVSDHLAEAEPA